MDFTGNKRNLRKLSPHIYEQAAKAWVVWAAFRLWDPRVARKGGIRIIRGVFWVHELNGELQCMYNEENLKKATRYSTILSPITLSH
jgi:hypothetical protein